MSHDRFWAILDPHLTFSANPPIFEQEKLWIKLFQPLYKFNDDFATAPLSIRRQSNGLSTPLFPKRHMIFEPSLSDDTLQSFFTTRVVFSLEENNPGFTIPKVLLETISYLRDGGKWKSHMLLLPINISPEIPCTEIFFLRRCMFWVRTQDFLSIISLLAALNFLISLSSMFVT